MRNGDLIRALQAFPEDLEVVLSMEDGDGFSVEFTPDFSTDGHVLDLDIGPLEDLEIVEREDVYLGPAVGGESDEL